jgi:DNA-binding XRE family transcriptional regulator
VAKNDDFTRWGNAIATRRKAFRMSQYDLAIAVGVRQPTVFRWEKGLMEPKWEHKQKLAAVLRDDVRVMFAMSNQALDDKGAA